MRPARLLKAPRQRGPRRQSHLSIQHSHSLFVCFAPWSSSRLETHLKSSTKPLTAGGASDPLRRSPQDNPCHPLYWRIRSTLLIPVKSALPRQRHLPCAQDSRRDEIPPSPQPRVGAKWENVTSDILPQIKPSAAQRWPRPFWPKRRVGDSRCSLPRQNRPPPRFRAAASRPRCHKLQQRAP